jgi:hypothetical protein
MEGNHAIFIATQLTTANRRTFVDARVSADTCGRVELVVTPMTYNLEYDHQQSYDVLDYSNTATVNYLFDGTDIAFNVVASDTNLADSFVILDVGALYSYYSNHRNTSYTGYLCGIKGFADHNGNFIDTVYGVTSDQYGYSFVRGYDHEYIGITDAHELGHQIADLPDLCTGSVMNPFHSDNSCLMGDMPIAICTGEDITSNPHFCDSCTNALKNASW